MTRVFLSLLIALAAALLAVAPAAAQQCNAPPGTAAVDQYCENVPSASGDGGGGGGAAAKKPSRDTVRAIARSDQGGEELNRYLGEEIASNTGSSDRSSKSRPAGGDTTQEDGPAADAPRQPSTNPLGAVQSAVNSGSTSGDAFFWALIAIALLIAGAAWLRHRRRSIS